MKKLIIEYLAEVGRLISSIENEGNLGIFLCVKRTTTLEIAVMAGLVLGCFLDLGFAAFAGCVWIRHRTSQNVVKRQLGMWIE